MKNVKVRVQLVKLFGLFCRLSPPSLRIFLKKQVFDRYIIRIGEAVIVKTRFGSKIKCRFPDTIQSIIFLTGAWEPCITRIVCNRLKTGDIFIDVGANIGYYALLAATKVGSYGKVYAIEASPHIYNLLQENIQMNSLSNVESRNIAVSNIASSCNIYLSSEENLGGSSIISSVARRDKFILEGKVECRPLSAIVPTSDLFRATIIKIDIEGAERLALEGLVGCFQNFSSKTEWIIEMCSSLAPRGQSDINWILDLFKLYGYTGYIVPNKYTTSFMLRYGSGMKLCPLCDYPRDGVGVFFDILFSRASSMELRI